MMEEWRLRRGAGARISDRALPIVLKGSRYADRVPIGKTDVLQRFKPERLKKFYADWYRPDLMAVVAIGDFDQAQGVDPLAMHPTRTGADRVADEPPEWRRADQPGPRGTRTALSSRSRRRDRDGAAASARDGFARRVAIGRQALEQRGG